ncbi:carboxypeptidase-like regulatory domain-containing protein [Bacteroidota bacterium]
MNFLRLDYFTYSVFSRRAIVLVCLALLLLGSISLNAQSNEVSISLSNTSVIAVLDQIRSQTDIDFVFNHEELEKCRNVSISVEKVSVEDVLTYCLAGSDLSFKKLKNTYIITPKEEKNDTQEGKAVKGSLKGKVIDRDSKVPLPYSTVMVLSTEPWRGATTDEDGYFRFGSLPVGRHTIMVSYVGYAELVMSEIFVGSSREIEILAEITEKSESIEEVFVSIGKGSTVNQMATVSSRSFSVEETKRYAASFSDPARMVLVFAGVAGNDDATNEIVIRGNSPNWLLWRLEGVEIPSPNHLSEEGFTSGAVSILSSDMLATSDFYMGAFPAEFGGALSGVFDLRMREGNYEKHEFSAQAGVLGLDFSAEGPFKKGYKGSYLLNYRYSTFSLMNKLNIQISENALPSYEDLSFKFNFPTKKMGTFSLWAIGGRSEVDEAYFPDSSESKILGYTDFTNSGMLATGITHTYYPDDKSYFRSVISYSNNFSSETYEIMDSLGLLNLFLADELQNNALRISSLYNRKFSRKLTMRTGATMNLMGYDFYSKIDDNNGSHKTFLNGNGNTSLFQGYMQGKYRISDRLITTAGLHYAYFALSNDHSLEPRLGLMYDLPGKQRLSFGYGRHSKNDNLPVYFVEVENEDGSHSYPNSELKMTRSDHFIAGYEKMIGDDFQIKSEVYLQLVNNLPVPTNPNKLWPSIFGGAFPDDTLANIGVARNYGIEFTFQKYFTDGYYFMLTNSLFDAKYKPANGQWYNSKYNLRHVSNLIGGKEFSWADKMLGINAKIMWSGGKRIFPLDLNASIEKGYAVFDDTQLYAKQAPDYFRIDFGINLHFFKQKTEHIFSLDIQNLTNRRNIWSEEYNPVLKELNYYYLTGFLPILNYRVEF